MNSSTSGGERLPRRSVNQEAPPGSSRSVLDSSAVLAVLFGEEGAENALPHLAAGCISAVNVSEVITKALRVGASFEAVRDFLSRLGLEVVPFDLRHALAAGSLQPLAGPHNLSLGDRACLALGLTAGRVVVTAERGWANVPLEVAVILIR